MTPDPDHMRRWIQNVYGELSPTNVVEVRVLGCRKQKTKATGWLKGSTRTGWFSSEDALIHACMDADQLEGTTYATLNPVSPDLLARVNNSLGVVREASKDTDVVTRRWLLVDVDHRAKPKGVPATDAERGECVSLSNTIVAVQGVSGWPQPMRVDSGNGVHLLWRVDLPADDGGLLERVLAGLDDTFSSERVSVDTVNHNPSRICKLGGAVARKGTGAVEVGRVWRTASILADGDPAVLTRYQLEGVAAHAPAAAPKGKPKQAGTRDCSTLSDKVAETVDSLIRKLDYWGVTYDPPFTKGDGAQLNVQCPRPANDRDPACTGDGSSSSFLIGEDGWGYYCKHDGCSRAGFDYQSMKALYTHGVVPEPARVEVVPEPLGEGWEDPLVDLPTYPLDVWNPRFAHYIQAAADASGADLAVPAAAMTALVSAALGSLFRVCLGPWHRPILWLGVIGGSAVARKSAGMRPILKVADMIQAKRYSEYMDRVEAWRELPKRDRDDAPCPNFRVFSTNDTTTEAVVTQFVDDSRSGLLVHSDELAGFFAGMNQYKAKGGADRQFWLSAYDGGPVTQIRSRAGATRYAEQTHVALVGGIQPRTLNKLGLDSDDGMFGRFLWSWVRYADVRKQTSYFYEHEDLRRYLSSQFNRVLGVEGGKATKALSHALGSERNLEGIKQHAEGKSLTSMAWSRTSGQAGRLAAMLHGSDLMADDKAKLDCGLVERAYRLADYYRDHMVYTVERVLNDEPDREKEVLAKQDSLDPSVVPARWVQAADVAPLIGWTRGNGRLGRALMDLHRQGKIASKFSRGSNWYHAL